jgi:hypothetical protein
MSTHIIGFVPPDDDWQRMKAIWDSCTAAGVDVPRAVEEFFNDCPPDDAGVEVGLPVTQWGDDASSGYELEVSAIPLNVKRIRFYNSW